MHKVYNDISQDDDRVEKFWNDVHEDLTIWERYALKYLIYNTKVVDAGLYELLNNMASPDRAPNEIKERYPDLVPKIQDNFRRVFPEAPIEPQQESALIAKLIAELMPGDISDLKFDLLVADYDRLFYEVGHPTGHYMAGYAADLLDPMENLTFADFCSGLGVMLDVVIPSKPKSITAIEINSDLSFVSYLRSIIVRRDYDLDTSNTAPEFIVQDVFKYSLAHPEQTFDRIFCHCPWNSVADMSEADFARLWENTPFEGVRLSPKSDWKYLAVALKHLAKNGKSCVVVPMSIEYKDSDREIRETFIKNGLIEQVVKMPRGSIPGSLSASYLIVVSRGNKTIRFTDLTESNLRPGTTFLTSLHDLSTEKVRKADENRGALMVEEESVPYNVKKPVRSKESIAIQRNEFRKADDKRGIYEELSADLKGKETVKTTSEILEDQRLDPTFHNLPVVENGIELAKVADIRRGTSFTKKFLDANLVDVATNIELIRLSNIHNGLIESMHFLDAMPEKAIVLQPGDILVTRVTSQIDVLIYVEKADEVKTLVDENFFVVRCKGDKNPFYLYAYLKSSPGQKQLAGNFRGTTVNKLRTQDLKKLNIPLVDKESINRIADRTQQNLAEIRKQKLDLSLAIEEQKNFLDSQFKGAI